MSNPYPTYKDSGLTWLGRIPSHWEVSRLKYVCRAFPSNVDKKSYDDQEPVKLCNYVDVYYNEEIGGDLPFMEATATPDQIVKFTLSAGDIVITKDSETPDDIAVAAYVPHDLPGVICGYHLAIVRPTLKMSGRYVKRLFDSYFLKAQFAVAAKGLTRFGLSQYSIDNVLLTVPPIEEQAAIATFLAREVGKIDALVAEQGKLIELLKEKRQAVISRAVTKGLDSTVRMKGSGVRWLDDIPAHWSIVPLMHLTAPGRPIMYGIVLPGPDVEQGIPIVKGGDVKSHRLSPESLCRTTPELEAPYARARLRTNDIVYSIRGTIGDAELVPEELVNANITQDVARISPRSDIDYRWLLYALKSEPIFTQLRQRSLGAAVPGINIFDLKRARIPVPSPLEQGAIRDFLIRETAIIDALISESEQAIALLNEHRSALISAAVTGKIDVCGLVEPEPSARQLELA